MCGGVAQLLIERGAASSLSLHLSLIQPSAANAVGLGKGSVPCLSTHWAWHGFQDPWLLPGAQQVLVISTAAAAGLGVTARICSSFYQAWKLQTGDSQTPATETEDIGYKL